MNYETSIFCTPSYNSVLYTLVVEPWNNHPMVPQNSWKRRKKNIGLFYFVSLHRESFFIMSVLHCKYISF